MITYQQAISRLRAQRMATFRARLALLGATVEPRHTHDDPLVIIAPTAHAEEVRKLVAEFKRFDS